MKGKAFVGACDNLRAFQDIAYLKWACDELRNEKNNEWAHDESGDLGALWHGSSDLWGRGDTMFRESFSRALDSLCKKALGPGSEECNKTNVPPESLGEGVESSAPQEQLVR